MREREGELDDVPQDVLLADTQPVGVEERHSVEVAERVGDTEPVRVTDEQPDRVPLAEEERLTEAQAEGEALSEGLLLTQAVAEGQRDAEEQPEELGEDVLDLLGEAEPVDVGHTVTVRLLLPQGLADAEAEGHLLTLGVAVEDKQSVGEVEPEGEREEQLLIVLIALPVRD